MFVAVARKLAEITQRPSGELVKTALPDRKQSGRLLIKGHELEPILVSRLEPGLHTLDLYSNQDGMLSKFSVMQLSTKFGNICVVGTSPDNAQSKLNELVNYSFAGGSAAEFVTHQPSYTQEAKAALEEFTSAHLSPVV